MGATLHNPLLSNPNEYANIGQTDVLRGYLMERRRALLTELASLDKILGIQPQTKAAKCSTVGK
jgi:hypothetical protein